jgi:hypothetical protein
MIDSGLLLAELDNNNCIFHTDTASAVNDTCLFAVLTKALCHITEVVSGPLVTALEQRKAINVKRCDELIREKQTLIGVPSHS